MVAAGAPRAPAGRGAGAVVKARELVANGDQAVRCLPSGGWRAWHNGGVAASFCEADGVLIRGAGHKGKGVFAARAFREGEVVMRFAGRVVHRNELGSLTAWESDHLGELTVETYQVLPEPRCYLNHGCAPNAVSTHDTVYALRAIAPGEELTIDYRLNAHDDGGRWAMECRCAAFEGPHTVVGDFFLLPEET